MNQRTSVYRAQQVLSAQWFILSMLAAGVLLIQTIVGTYGDQVERAWSWFLPNVIPILTLILTVLVAEARGAGKTGTVGRFIYRLTIGLSLIYLLLILGCLSAFQWLAREFAGMRRLELLELSNLFLSPLQALVGLALGLFFVSRQDE
jgi:hypothetical protein